MFEPSRPYKQEGMPSSGYAKGASTSKDAEPHRAGAQEELVELLNSLGPKGVTWREATVMLRRQYAKHREIHHGTVSGALSALHKDKRIARLTERRKRCLVYVALDYVDGRETRPQGRGPKHCWNCGEEQ
jgi:hypothetical protein